MALRSAVPSLATRKLSFQIVCFQIDVKNAETSYKVVRGLFSISFLLENYVISLFLCLALLSSLVVGKGRKITSSLRDSLACLWQRRQPGLSLRTLPESSPGLCVLRNSFLRNLGFTALLILEVFHPSFLVLYTPSSY